MTLRAAVAVALLSAGCSYNPGYFPYLLPGGPVAETHAKPGGPGYFRDFDPKACKVEVTPADQVTAPLGTAVVLVGTVADADGQPRRGRRLEWLLDGPGHLVEVDESGFTPNRGYKKDAAYAVTHTNYAAKTLTRGNDDPADDVTVAAGQTFCVVTSNVPGETVVTAYAPAVFNWQNNRKVVRITWGDGRYSFPAPAVVRPGGEHTLTTVAVADRNPAGYRVRYTVLDGPPAVLVARAGTSRPGGGAREAEATPDADGAAAVTLRQESPAAGKTRVKVEVVKPPEGGAGPGKVVASRDAVVEWAEPKLHLAVTAPPAAAATGTFPVTVALENDVGVDSRDAQVRVTLSDGATLASSDHLPRVERGGTLVFALPPVPGKGKQSVTLQVKPARVGAVTVTAEAATGDGLQATGRAVTRAEAGKLQLLVEGPATGTVGPELPFRVAVTNGGPVPAGNVTVWARFDPGLRYATPHDPVELAVGTLQPGQTKTLDLPLTATRSGRFAVRATATGDGELSATAEPAAVDVRRVELSAAAAGPKLAYLNQDFDWTVTVRNAGDAPVTGVVVRAAVPPEVRARSAVEWRVGELKPGDVKTFTVSATAAKLADRAPLAVTVTSDGSAGAAAEAAVAVIGTAAVVLELAAPGGPVEVGKRVAYRVRVKNQGTVSARDVEVAAVVPPELRPVRGGGGRVAFPVVEELRPGEARTFTVEADAVQAGDARFRAEVKAAHLTQPLAEEQATRVTAR